MSYTQLAGYFLCINDAIMLILNFPLAQHKNLTLVECTIVYKLMVAKPDLQNR